MPIEKTKPAPLLSALAAAETTTSGVWEPPALSTIDGVAAAMSVVLSGRVLTALIGMLLAAKEREYGPSGCARVGRRRVLAKARAMGLNATIVVDVVRGGLCCSVVGVDCLVYALGTTEVVGCLWICDLSVVICESKAAKMGYLYERWSSFRSFAISTS